MTVRDLGYRPYEGERLPASHNSSVLLSHGLGRAWGSWLVKIAAFTGWIPPIIAMTIAGGYYYLTQQAGPGVEAEPLPAADVVNQLLWVQLWGFVTLITVGAGSAVIAEDLQFRAFQFYFAKPVTPTQYLLGRIGAVGIWVLGMTLIPALLLVPVLAGTAPEDLRLERLGLFLPAIFQSLIIAVVTATASVGISSLSKSRALTMSAWIVLFIVPHGLTSIIEAIGDWPWLNLVSLPDLLEVVGDALFKVEPESALRWYHAAPVLVALVVGSVVLAHRRISQAEVIT